MTAFSASSDNLTDRWDIKGARAALFKTAHSDFVPFGSFIAECSETVAPLKSPDKDWPVYGVNNREGVFLSHYQKGSDFRSSYKIIKKDWFFHNPTRVNVGSIGRVPTVPTDAITSPEYQVWSARAAKAIPGYIDALIKMPFFDRLIQLHRVGAVKERLFTRNLMQIPVPDRDPKFQLWVEAEWQHLRRSLVKARERIASLEEKLVAEVLVAADVTIQMPPSFPKSFDLDSAESERWGVGFNRHRWALDTILSSGVHQTVPLSSVAAVNPPRRKKLLPSCNASFVPMDAVSATAGSIDWMGERSVGEIGNGFTAFEDDDVIWAKITPCMQNGKCAVAKSLTNGLGFGSTEFHVVRSLDKQIVLPEYIWVILRLRSVRQAAQRYFTGSAGQQRVPEDFLRNLFIPLPDAPIQEKIVTDVLAARELVKSEYLNIDEQQSSGIARLERCILSGELG